MQPPAQELVAKDLHDQSWTCRHIYRGQPKWHWLTTGWSVFVSSKRHYAGDSILFIRDEKAQLLLGTRRANRQQPTFSSSVISSDSMHIGVLATEAHATANNSPFSVFYNPSPSEFVIPIAKYNKAMYTQVSLGMRFRMMFETEETGVRKYMGTVTGISDLDPIRWKNSQWHKNTGSSDTQPKEPDPEAVALRKKLDNYKKIMTTFQKVLQVLAVKAGVDLASIPGLVLDNESDDDTFSEGHDAASPL